MNLSLGLSINLLVCVSISLSSYLSTDLSYHLFSVYLSIYLSIHLFVDLPICLSIYISICLSSYPSIHLSTKVEADTLISRAARQRSERPESCSLPQVWSCIETHPKERILMKALQDVGGRGVGAKPQIRPK